MDHIIEFEKYEDGHFAMFNCKDGGWQLSRELGFHKCSPPRDYFVRWIECDGKYTLYITSYNSGYNVICKDNYIVTVDTLFDVLDYICKNKHTHY